MLESRAMECSHNKVLKSFLLKFAKIQTLNFMQLSRVFINCTNWVHGIVVKCAVLEMG